MHSRQYYFGAMDGWMLRWWILLERNTVNNIKKKKKNKSFISSAQRTDIHDMVANVQKKKKDYHTTYTKFLLCRSSSLFFLSFF